jgi:hypothetical protein
MECLVSSAQISYSIFNLTDIYNNNRFHLSFPTGSSANTATDFIITVPDGIYTIDDLNSFMQQYAISNGLYLIDGTGNSVYYTPALYLNTVSYAVQLLLYTVPRTLPSGFTQPSDWVRYNDSTYSADRIPRVHILATSNFVDLSRVCAHSEAGHVGENIQIHTNTYKYTPCDYSPSAYSPYAVIHTTDQIKQKQTFENGV